MQRKAWVIVALILLCAAVAGYFLLLRQAEPPPLAEEFIPAQPAAAPPPAPAPTLAEPAIAHPLASAATGAPLPGLEQSDAAIAEALRAVLGKEWKDILWPDTLIHNLVATVDNLPRQYLPAKVVPLKRVPGAFITSGEGDELSIDTANRERYTAYVGLFEAVDSARLVAVYRQFYPLFQRAYVEIGYPNGYFNDRLVEAIDDLLAAPAPDEPIRLVRPRVLYCYADAPIEALSAGQRIMIRIGSENAVRLKSKLREIRQNVAQDHAAAPSHR